MSKNILIILGHPDKQSYCGALADAYAAGAIAAGHTVDRINLSEISFDPVMHHGYKELPEAEPDLLQAQRMITNAAHIVWVYPTWWGTMPALLKGFIDRVFLPGFAFKYRKDSVWWDKLLKRRSSRLIVTMDAPPFYNWLVNGSPGHKAMKKTILQFCGIDPVCITSFGPVRHSTPEKRQKWMKKVNDLGKKGL